MTITIRQAGRLFSWDSGRYIRVTSLTGETQQHLIAGSPFARSWEVTLEDVQDAIDTFCENLKSGAGK